MELNKSDFMTDLKNFGSLQRSFITGSIPDDFTEQYEGFTDKLTMLWIDKQGYHASNIPDDIEYPKDEALINMFCKTVFPSEVEEETESVFFSSSLIKKKKENETNKTLELLTFLTNNEMNISQFLEIEIEVILTVINLVAEKKKEEREKERRKKRKGV